MRVVIKRAVPVILAVQIIACGSEDNVNLTGKMESNTRSDSRVWVGEWASPCLEEELGPGDIRIYEKTTITFTDDSFIYSAGRYPDVNCSASTAVKGGTVFVSSTLTVAGSYLEVGSQPSIEGLNPAALNLTVDTAIQNAGPNGEFSEDLLARAEGPFSSAMSELFIYIDSNGNLFQSGFINDRVSSGTNEFVSLNLNLPLIRQ